MESSWEGSPAATPTTVLSQVCGKGVPSASTEEESPAPVSSIATPSSQGSQFSTLPVLNKFKMEITSKFPHSSKLVYVSGNIPRSRLFRGWCRLSTFLIRMAPSLAASLGASHRSPMLRQVSFPFRTPGLENSCVLLFSVTLKKKEKERK